MIQMSETSALVAERSLHEDAVDEAAEFEANALQRPDMAEAEFAMQPD